MQRTRRISEHLLVALSFLLPFSIGYVDGYATAWPLWVSTVVFGLWSVVGIRIWWWENGDNTAQDKMPRILWLWVGFLGWSLLSALLGPRPGIGLLTTAKTAAFSLAAMAFVLRRGLRRATWWRVTAAFIAGLAALILYSLLLTQYGGKSAPWPFFKNANHFAAVLCLPVFPLLALTLRKRAGESWKNLLAGLLLLLFLVGIAASQSRGAWIGLFVGLFLGGLYAMPAWPHRLLLLLAFGLVVLFGEALLQQIKRDRQQLPAPLEYILSTADAADDFSNRERLMRWTCAWRMFQDRPLRGHGPGNYAPTFKHFIEGPEEKARISYWFGWRDGAHSDYLTVLAETGAPGFLLLVAFLLWWLRIAWQRMWATTDRGSWRLHAAIVAAVGTWMGHAFFNDLFVTDALLWGLFLLLATGITMNQNLLSLPQTRTTP